MSKITPVRRTTAKGPASLRPVILSLEPRLMFDGAAIADAAEAAAQKQAPADAPDVPDHAAPVAAPAETQGQRAEIVVVDWTVQDYRTLIAGMDPSIPVIVLQPGQSGLDGLAAVLSEYRDLDAIHLVTHGWGGAIQLGGQFVTGDVLAANADDVRAIADALKANGDLMLYGCSVANGERGQDFMADLSRLLGDDVDIAASTDKTGPARLGGDWDLEWTSGDVETVLPFTLQGMEDIGHCLGCTLGGQGSAVIYMNGKSYSGTLVIGPDGTTVYGVATDDYYVGTVYYMPTTAGKDSPFNGVANIGFPTFEQFQNYYCGGSDSTPPTITSVSIPTDATYRTGQQLNFTVNFDENVTVTGTPRLALTLDSGGTVYADYVSGTGTQALVFRYTVASGNLDANGITVGTLANNGGSTIKDAAGNAATLALNGVINTANVRVDGVAPRVTSIDRQTPSGANTAADTLVWRVTFDDAVSNLDATDFSVTGTTGTVASVVSAGGNAYDVTVSGGDLANANGTVTLAFAGGHNVTDAAGNALNTTPTGTNNPTYTVDNTAPRVTAIDRQTPSGSTTNADTLVWRVTFDGAVSNVDAADFAVSGTTATVTNVASAGGNAYDVTLSGGDLANLDGTVTLSFAGGQNIADAAGNALGNTTPTGANNPTYTMDNTAPRVTSIDRQNPSGATTNADSLVWRVSFDGPVANLDATDFTVTGTTATVTSVTSAGGNAYDVTVSGGTLASVNGAVTLAFAGGQNVTDAAGNALNPTPTGTNNPTYTLDNTAPRVASIERQNPTGAATAADTLVWRVTFDDAVSNLDTTDFTVTGTTATVTSVTSAGGNAYDVTVSGGDLANANGTVTLAFAGGQNVTDAAGNALNTTPTGANDTTYTLDNAGPRITAIDRQNPSGASTNADSLVFRVTFDEAVVNLDAADFTVSGTTATVTNVASAGGNAYDVTLSGGDLATLDATVTLGFAGAQNIADGLGNALTTTTPTGTNNATYTVDNTAPTVVSIDRQTPSGATTNADTLVFRVTFDGAVSNLDAGDFTVTGTTGTVTTVASAGGNAYDVTVSGGDLAGVNGTVTLAFAGGHNIADAAGNALTTTTPTGTNNTSYTLDNTAPRVASIDRHNPAAATTIAGTLVWRVTFDEAVSNLDTTDFSVSGTTGTVTNVASAGGNAYDVTVSGGDLASVNGAVTLAFAGGQNIADSAGNALGNTTPTGTNNASYTHQPAPRVTSIERQTPMVATTAADTLVWRVTFGQAVNNLDASDFAVTGSTATVTDVVSAGGNAYDVTVSGGDLASATATVTLGFAGAQDIQDALGNALNTTPTGTNNNTYTVDNTAPRMASIVRQTPAGATTNANSVVWRVIFDEAVSNVDAADFTVSGTTGTVTNVASAGGNAYDVTVSGGDMAALNGGVTLSLAGSQDIADAAGNALTTTTPTGTADTTYTLDNTAPTVTAIDRQTPTGATTNADSLTWRVSFDEAVTGLDAADFTVTGTTGTVTNVASAGGNAYDVTVSGGDLAGVNGTVTLGFAGGQNIADTAGNALAATTPTGTNNASYTLDNTAPRITSIERQTPSGATTNADTLVWRVTFDGAVSHLDAADFTVTGTTGTVTNVASAGGNAYDVTVSGGDLANANGTITLAFAGGHNVTDVAGNGLNTTPTGSNNTTYTLDNTAPRVTAIARQTPGDATTNAGTLVWRVTFDDAVSNLDAADFTVTGTTGTVTNVASAGGNAYDITVSGGDLATTSGTVTLAFAGGHNVSDAVGNALNATPSGSNDNTYTLDHAGPRITAITRHTPTGATTNADTLVFRVTFDEAVTGLDAGDFTVTGTTATVTNVVSAGGNAYDVTLSGGDLASVTGTVALALADEQNIADSLGNALTNATPTGTNNASYTLDNSAPAAPAAPVLAPDADTGTAGDSRTSIAAPTLNGMAEANATVRIYDGATLVATTTADGSGRWSVATAGLADGSHGLTVTATDAAGNTGSASSPLTVHIDTVAPAVPAVPAVPVLAPGAGSSAPTLNGTAEANATVRLYDGATLVATTTADGSGRWSVTSAALTDGRHGLTVTATDAAGNTSAASAPLTVTIDSVAPAVPSAPVLAPSSDTGIGGDNRTAIAAPVLSGTAEANATVRIYDGATLVATTTADGSGRWSVATAALADGSHALTVTATDAAGNTSGVSAALTVVIDGTPPPAPVLAATGGSSTAVPVSGVAEPRATVRIYAGGMPIGSVVADDSGAWTFTATLAVGTHTLTATATDAANNTSPLSAAAMVTVAAPPAASPAAPAPSAVAAPPATTTTTAVSDSADRGADSLRTVVRSDSGVPSATPGNTTAITASTASSGDGGGQGQPPSSSQTPATAPAQQTVTVAETRTTPAPQAFQVVVAPRPAGGGDQLVVNTRVPDAVVAEGSRIAVTIPAEAFAHTRADAVVTLTAQRADGGALPGWMSFNPRTGTFEGTPPPGFKGEVVVKVVARDKDGREAVQEFKIVVGAAGQGNLAPQGGDGQGQGQERGQDQGQPQDGQGTPPPASGPSGESAPGKQAARPAGRPSLTAQLHALSQEGRAARQAALFGLKRGTAA